MDLDITGFGFIEQDPYQPELVVDHRDDLDIIKCPICRQIFNKPVSCDSCKNHYCNHCITNWIRYSSDSGSCPACKNYRQGRPYPILINILSKIKFKCKHFNSSVNINSNHLSLYKQQQTTQGTNLSSGGCKALLGYDMIQSHLQYECEYQQNKCPSEGCNDQMLKHEI